MTTAISPPKQYEFGMYNEPIAAADREQPDHDLTFQGAVVSSYNIAAPTPPVAPALGY